MGSELSGVRAVVLPGPKMEEAISERDRKKRREPKRGRESLREPKTFRLLVGVLRTEVRSSVRADSCSEIVFIILYRSTKGVT